MSDNTDTNPDEPRKGDMLWPGMVIGLLILSVGIGLSVVYAANFVDDGAQVEMDYYQRAVHWDSHQAQVERGMALGWQLDVRPSPERVTVRVTGPDGQPVQPEGGTLLVRRASQSAPHIQGDLAPLEDGTLALDSGLALRGLWDFIVELDTGSGQLAAFQVRRELR
ncbi:MAG: hypothetical protein EA398_01980 [Deltaproteobacteria bacterium]|nr:MAG: hypothetical protein EA398_01980 [Deltaproteobacteria bacterium]